MGETRLTQKEDPEQKNTKVTVNYKNGNQIRIRHSVALLFVVTAVGDRKVHCNMALLEIRPLPQPPALELSATTNVSFSCIDDYRSGTKKLTKTKTKAAHGRGRISCGVPVQACTFKKINP